jgi:hypothetical protein
MKCNPVFSKKATLQARKDKNKIRYIFIDSRGSKNIIFVFVFLVK